MTMFGEALNCRQNCIPSALYLFFVRLFKIRSCVNSIFHGQRNIKGNRYRIIYFLLPFFPNRWFVDLFVRRFAGVFKICCNVVKCPSDLNHDKNSDTPNKTTRDNHIFPNQIVTCTQNSFQHSIKENLFWAKGVLDDETDSKSDKSRFKQRFATSIWVFVQTSDFHLGSL